MRIRVAVPQDARDIAKVNIRSWRETYKGIFPQEALDALDVEKWTKGRKEQLEKSGEKEFTFVVEKDSKIVGFSAIGPYNDGNPHIEGEIHTIYLLKKIHGKKIGKRLFLKAFGQLKKMGFQLIHLWVLQKNPSLPFFKKMGGKITKSKIHKRFHHEYKAVRFSWNI